MTDIDWGNVTKKGAEAFAGYVGGAIGEAVIGELFQTGTSDADMFRSVIEDLKRSIQEGIDDAFLREYTGKTIGLEENLGTYMRTLDSKILYEILNDSSQLVHTFLQFDSLEVLVNLVRITNVYLTTLVALAKVRNKPPYREEWKEKAKMLADKVEQIANKHDERIRNSLSDIIVTIGEVKSPALCESEPGFTYELSAFCKDKLNGNFVGGNVFREFNCKKFPFRRVEDHDDVSSISVSHAFTQEDKENHKSFHVLEEIKKTLENDRFAALDKILLPTREAITKWREARSVSPSFH